MKKKIIRKNQRNGRIIFERTKTDMLGRKMVLHATKGWRYP